MTNRSKARFLNRLSRSLRIWANFLIKMAGKSNVLSYRITYSPRDDDIFIVSYPKSGTTWMQAIVWEIVHPNIDFQHISTAIPHLEENLIPRNIDFDTLASPRIVKSHLTTNDILRGNGKYIYVVRNAPDVAASFYEHHVRYLRYSGDAETFFRDFFHKRDPRYWGTWFSHTKAWTNRPPVKHLLVVRYEDMKIRFEEEIHKISEFLGIQLDNARIAQITKKCSVESMKEHISKFELVRNGTVGDGEKHMTNELRTGYIRQLKRYARSPIMNSYIEMASEFMERGHSD